MSETNSLLNHYYNNYTKFFRENKVLTNQLSIIEAETKELKEKF